MDALTSAREIQFLERSLINTFVPFRQISFGLLDDNPDDDFTYGVSGFRFPTGPYGGNVGDNGGYGGAGRATYVFAGPGKEDPLLHVGADYSYMNSSFNALRYVNNPPAFVSQFPPTLSAPNAALPNQTLPFVDTGLLPAHSANLDGLELGGRAGSFHAQGELYFLNLNRIAATNNYFWGAYVQAGYILTGEVLPYSKANGVFSRVVPKNPVKRGGGWGAWEIAGRVDTIDLNSRDVRGGRATDLTAGLNWYLNQRTKFQFNYVYNFLDRVPVGSAAGAAQLGSNASVFATRTQIDF